MAHAPEISSVRIVSAEVDFVEQSLVKPLLLSTGAISVLTEARAAVHVRANGHEAVGRGSIYLSDLWAWPDPALSHEHRDAELRRVCATIARELSAWLGGDAAHPLELGMRLHSAVCDHHRIADSTRIPSLALAMALSPFDAGIHDAVGHALGVSAFALYREDAAMPSVDHLFAERCAAKAIRRVLRPLDAPRREMPAWLIVGKNDDLERDVRPWIEGRGYHCIKLKLMGKDARADAERTVDVHRAASRWSGSPVSLSVDSNEGNPDADSVLAYLDRLRSSDPRAFEALRYLEQPTGRDISVHRFDWRSVSAIKPVMLDEGLTSLELLDETARQGWSGLALKTCKGHSFALAAAAWAHERGMSLSLQDLTNPGLSAIHAAWMAAMLPTINGVELNSPQFTPAANQPWLPRLSRLLVPSDGTHRLDGEPPIGLGSSL